MQAEYDTEAKTWYFYPNGPGIVVARTEELIPEVLNVDLDGTGRVLGIEYLPESDAKLRRQVETLTKALEEVRAKNERLVASVRVGQSIVGNLRQTIRLADELKLDDFE